MHVSEKMKVYVGTLNAVSSEEYNFWTNLYEFELIDISGIRIQKLEAAPEMRIKIHKGLGSSVSLYVKDGLIAGLQVGKGPILYPNPLDYLFPGLLLLMLGLVGWIAIVPGLICWMLAWPLLRQYIAYKTVSRVTAGK